MLSIFGLLGMAAVGAAAFVGLDSADEDRAAPDRAPEDDMPDDGNPETAPDLFDQVLSDMSAAADDDARSHGEPAGRRTPPADERRLSAGTHDRRRRGRTSCAARTVQDQIGGYAGDDTILGERGR
ncbi:MAG: hypothetical protein U5K36_04960 [Roseovarius sp.]|nr:hypothetical protein [Roseovarius sp.]